MKKDTIQIAGAGPAGLAAAITLAQAGFDVQVSEARSGVGQRFGGDLQGLENWTTEQDALEWMRQHDLTTDFEKLACYEGTAFDADGHAFRISSRDAPLFYMLERGGADSSLDSALLRQALALGVQVRFNHRLKKLDHRGILAIGPRAADAIAVGYHFKTDSEDGFWVICDNELAPGGYAYLLIMNGRGTVKSCMFSGFKQERLYVDRTVKAFERLVGLKMHEPEPHGGVGNFLMPASAMQGRNLLVGEQAGFQDTLFGFGIRYAMSSGILAARSLITGEDYAALWRRELAPLLKASVVNRALYNFLGNRGFSFFLKRFSEKPDVRKAMRRHYRAGLLRRLLYPWARWRYRSRRQDQQCLHEDCNCVWCRGHKTGSHQV